MNGAKAGKIIGLESKGTVLDKICYQRGTVPADARRGPFLFVSSVCTVDLLMPNFCAAARTVVRFSMMY